MLTKKFFYGIYEQLIANFLIEFLVLLGSYLEKNAVNVKYFSYLLSRISAMRFTTDKFVSWGVISMM